MDYKFKNAVVCILSLIFYIYSSSLAYANLLTLSKVRVTYRPDGVSVTTFNKEACGQKESEISCMDRIYGKNDQLRGLPYDDMDPSQLPKDRKDRDKWTGEKGRGVRIDASLVTKNEKLKEFQSKLDQELDKDSPDSIGVARLQRNIEKLKALPTAGNILSLEDLAELNRDSAKKGLLASAVENITSAVSSAFDGLLASIQNGFLSLKQLVTNTLKVGTPENPSGITIYDQTTKQPFCLTIKDGKIQNLPGECNSSATASLLDSAASTDSSSATTTNSTTLDTTTLDSISPTITLNGPATIEIEKGTAWTDPGATVVDPAVGEIPANTNLSIYYKLDGVETANGGREPVQIDTSVLGSHTIIYSATDSAGNIGTAERTVNVVAPVEILPAEPAATTTPIGE